MNKLTPHEARTYWKEIVNSPESVNYPLKYLGLHAWERSIFLAHIIRDLQINQYPILELGCNIGRNLMMLRYAGFSPWCLHGIEINKNAIDLMRSEFMVSEKFMIHVGTIEDFIITLPSNFYGLVFTMAVLEHLPKASEEVFEQMVRISKKYILTIEDERCHSPRHFPRNYKRVFEGLGVKQVRLWERFPSLSKSFKARLFIKDEQNITC